MWEIKRKDGLYVQERVTDEWTGESKIISVKCKDESRVERKRAKEKLEKKINSGKPQKSKLSDLFALYEKEQEKTVKASSFLSYVPLDKRIIDVVGDVYVNKLTAGYIKKVMLDSGKNLTTLNSYISRLKACLKWAYMNDLIGVISGFRKLPYPHFIRLSRFCK